MFCLHVRIGTTDDSYANNINKAIGIFSMIARKWDDDFGVWYRAHW